MRMPSNRTVGCTFMPSIEVIELRTDSSFDGPTPCRTFISKHQVFNGNVMRKLFETCVLICDAIV